MADTYWLRRQRRSDERMARRERSLEGRVRRVYERELRDLEREIADYYERYGENGVLRYRSMLQTMGDADRRLLIEDCEEFARQHPDLADMVEIRKSIYRLDRLEGLRTSVRLHLARATVEATGGLDEHFAEDAADAMNAVAETMGYGSSFYSADSEVVRQFVGTAWSDGKSYSDNIWEDARKVASYVERDLSKALVRGASYQSLCREMQRRFEGQSVSNIMRVVQTEGTYVARQAQGAEMRREGFEEYFLDPLGDSRTCDECRRLGRQSHDAPFRFEDAEVGVNYPPIHPRCRCEVNPAVEDWDEWLRKRRAERRAQAAASEVSGEAVARRFGGKLKRIVDELMNPSLGIVPREYQAAQWILDAISEHFKKRSAQRGVREEQAIDAVSRPVDIRDGGYDDLDRPSTKYIGSEATVVINPETGKVITVWKTEKKRKRGGRR